MLLTYITGFADYFPRLVFLWLWQSGGGFGLLAPSWNAPLILSQLQQSGAIPLDNRVPFAPIVRSCDR
jgi:hypothetical protein